MRARLQTMKRSQSYSFICDKKMADKIERVINLNGGILTSKSEQGADYMITVMKGE